MKDWKLYDYFRTPSIMPNADQCRSMPIKILALIPVTFLSPLLAKGPQWNPMESCSSIDIEFGDPFDSMDACASIHRTNRGSVI